MTSQSQAGRLSSQRSWPASAALVALSAIPLIAGPLRMVLRAATPAGAPS